MTTGPQAFDAQGFHRRIRHWPSGDQVTQNDMAALFTPGTEIFIEGIHWHEVISGETSASIATMWQVPLASLQRANPGVTLSQGMRLLVPVQ
jgi:hypothetical protein